jgi:hypothetical protein
MSSRLIALGVCAMMLGVPVAASAQDTPAGRPAPSNVHGQEYPRILPDRRVIFRARAPEAKTVAVRARGHDSGMGAEAYPLKPIGEGVWEATIGPIRAGFHYYELLLDGHAMNDPASLTYFGWARPTSGLEVPDDTLTFNIFDGLTIRNTEVAFWAGVKDVAGAKGLVVRNCRIENVGAGVVTQFAGSKDFYIADNIFLAATITAGCSGGPTRASTAHIRSTATSR